MNAIALLPSFELMCEPLRMVVVSLVAKHGRDMVAARVDLNQ